MTSEELQSLMVANGIENANQLAIKLDCNRSMCWKWLNGQSVITKSQAAFIRSVLTKKAK